MTMQKIKNLIQIGNRFKLLFIAFNLGVEISHSLYVPIETFYSGSIN